MAYRAEKERRLSLEAELTALRHSKDLISNTILDSLNKEKERRWVERSLSSLYVTSRRLNIPFSVLLAVSSSSLERLVQELGSSQSRSQEGDSPELSSTSLLDELRQMREELRRIEEGAPVLSPSPKKQEQPE